MGINITSRQMPLSPADALKVLQEETDSFGTFFNLDRILYHEARYRRISHTAYPEWHAMCGTTNIRTTQREEVRRVLTQRFGVPEYKFVDKHGSTRLDANTMDTLLKDHTLSADVIRFLELYRTISAADYMTAYLGQYRELPRSVAEDMDGQRMVVAHPTWKLLSTSRFSASNPSVQNIKRDLCDIYTAPKGWQLVFSDSGQIEPRITYSAYIRDDLIVKLITMYDDAYYGLLHYIQLSDEEEHHLRQHLDEVQCHPITEEMSSKRQRLKTLGLAGNYGSANLSSIDAELGPLYERKIVNHPARRAWEAEVKAEVRAGADCFSGYFGTPVYPDNTAKYAKGDASWMGHVVRCGINNPIQTTAAELMCFSIHEAKKVLQPGDHIGSYKHDEGMFYIKEDRVDELAPKLRECLSYQVKDWIPIGSDLHVGRKETPHIKDLF